MYIIKGAYAMLKRASDNAVIKTKSIELSLDWDSWCWSFKADIVGSDALELVKPDPTPVECIATVNGHIWRVIVEEWNEQHSFASHSFVITGRSTGALLDDPYTLAAIYRNSSSSISARQQIEQILQPFGYTVQWEGVTDWLIAKDALSINATPAKAVSEIAGVVGAIAFDHQSDPRIIIRPRHKFKSWFWAGSTPDVSIPEQATLSLSGRYIPPMDVNGIYVSGTAAGAAGALVRVTGTAGDKLLPDVSHALFTDPAACLQRGIYELSAHRTAMIRYTIALPLFSPGSQPQIGVLLPGTFIEFFHNGRPRKGPVAGVTVAADTLENGTIVTRQTIEVFTHL
jgi:hypothetical protein